MAAILGQVRSFLVGLPSLRAFTDALCSFANKGQKSVWNSCHVIPQELKDQLKEIKLLLDTWRGRPFLTEHQRTLYSDISDLAWGGARSQDRKHCAGILEGKKSVAHKCIRVGSSSQHYHDFGKQEGNSAVKCRQHHSLFVHYEGRGQEDPSEQNHNTILFNIR